MKRIVLSAALAGLLAFPTISSARLGDGIDALKNDRLMKEFAINSVITGPVSQIRTYELTPAIDKMKGKIVMKLQFNDQQKLAWSELWISQEYQKEQPVFSKHYAGRFLLTHGLPQDTGAVFRPLCNELEYRVEEKNVHMLGEIPPMPEKPTPAYLAISGRSKKYGQTLKATKYSIEEIKKDGKIWTKIRIEPK